jgi:hypothetical protein
MWFGTARRSGNGRMTMRALQPIDRVYHRLLGGNIYFDGGPDELFPQGRVLPVREWLPVIAIQRGCVTYFWRLVKMTLPTGGQYLIYAYANSRRTPGIDEDA